ncbi:hypothetical protein L6452_20358 [Arctium lappa]|uniref:Uncharacterized protein n=1 Tax=Arctium lappa TaxID=4217 RepID=A0ACB9BAA9_ARCLA|nr:hypothetical protein L6452_20358 [Arctium lappa]
MQKMITLLFELLLVVIKNIFRSGNHIHRYNKYLKWLRNQNLNLSGHNCCVRFYTTFSVHGARFHLLSHSSLLNSNSPSDEHPHLLPSWIIVIL